MRDLLLYLHILAGLAIIMLPFIIISLKNKSSLLKPLSFLTAAISWLILIPAGKFYTTFYPATKTLIKAGSLPWAHSIIMETKEHWGLLLPIIGTVAAGLVFNNKLKDSKRWWILLSILSVILAIMGRIVTIGGTK